MNNLKGVNSMKVGIIGFGLRAKTILDAFSKVNKEIQVIAIVDYKIDSIRQDKKILSDNMFKHVKFYNDVDEMMTNHDVDGVFVTTNCDSHVDIAIKLFKYGKPMYLEKPIATNLEDLKGLVEVYEKNPQMKDKIVVSFPLKLSPLLKLVKEIVDSGKLGKIEHVQAVNNVPYGRVYYQSWYRDEKITGGLFLQKTTHDFDYINYLLSDLKPVEIVAMSSKQLFKGDKPSGLKCIDCEEKEECPENVSYVKDVLGEEVFGEYCVFAIDTGNQDSGSTIIRYDSGMHVVYSQNFFVRKDAGKRGARLVGYNGTLEFDWYKDEIKVFMHHTPRVETYKIDSKELSHSGGDEELARNFINIMINSETKTKSSLDEAILSCLMCLKAKESDIEHAFKQISFD